jgi:FMN-binding protein
MKRLVIVLLLAVPAAARVLETQQQALASVGAKLTRQTFFLTKEQAAAAGVETQLVVRYAAPNGVYVYFDSHRVRTEAETVMIVVDANDAISRIDILSFNEPTDYFPKRRWLDQFLGRKLDKDLALNGAIRPISGASLTGTAIVNASRKILAIHHVLPK